MTRVDYDPFAPAVLADPYPFYRALRERSPVHFLEKYDAWALARFEDVWQAYQDDEHFSVAQGTIPPQLLTRVLPPFPNLNHLDPPEHTRLRAALMHLFLPRRARALEARVRARAAARIDAFRGRGRADAVSELAQPVAMEVGCLVMGLPIEDAPALLDLIGRFSAREPGTPGMTADGVAAWQQMQDYLQSLSRQRRRAAAQRDDALEVFLRVELGGRRLDDEQVANHVTLLLIGSEDTSPKAFASALLQLERHPDQRAQLAARPALLPTALLEVLRYEPPVQFMMRTVRKPVEIGGRALRPGQALLLLNASANRDAREFPDPDRFDIHRNPLRIVSFGHGAHRCLGVQFARLELRVMLEELLRRVPDYRIDLAGAVRGGNEFVRGYASLPIEFAPQSA
jgi:cytochrome P450